MEYDQNEVAQTIRKIVFATGTPKALNALIAKPPADKQDIVFTPYMAGEGGSNVHVPANVAPPKIPEDPEALMTEVAAGNFLGVGKRAMQNWRLQGTGPKFVRISSRCIRYRKRDLITYADERLRCSTSDQEEANAPV